MKVIHFTDSKIGGVIQINADLSFNNSDSIQFDVIRTPTSTLTNTLGLSVKVTQNGSVSVSALVDNVWVLLKQTHVNTPAHINIVRSDVFIWSVVVASQLDQALNKTIVIDHQDDFLAELLSSATLVQERASQVTVDLYTTSLTCLTNLVIEADRNVWN